MNFATVAKVGLYYDYATADYHEAYTCECEFLWICLNLPEQCCVGDFLQQAEGCHVPMGPYALHTPAVW